MGHRRAMHVLQLASGADGTIGECSCGAWQRAVTSETVAITGRSREASLREAHRLHALGLDAPATFHLRK